MGERELEIWDGVGVSGRGCFTMIIGMLVKSLRAQESLCRVPRLKLLEKFTRGGRSRHLG